VGVQADFSPVTIADREAETRVCELLAQTYPDDGIGGVSLLHFLAGVFGPRVAHW